MINSAVSIISAVFLIVVLFQPVSAIPSANLLVNTSFEQSDAGKPSGWQLADHGNSAELSTDTGRDGGSSAKIDIKSFKDGWVVFCQDNTVKVREGRQYRLSFYAKGSGTSGAQVMIMCTDPWVGAMRQGFNGSFPISEEWKKKVINFRGSLDTDKTRFEFVFSGTGTVWIDDVELVEYASGEKFNYINSEGVTNLVPNSSFELGTEGWGTLGSDHLTGEIDRTTASDGECSLKFTLGPETYPLEWQDWPQPHIRPRTDIKLANIGWVKLKKGQPYTLSMYMKSDKAGYQWSDALPVNIGVRLGGDGQSAFLVQEVWVTRQWKRHSMTFTPAADSAFITIQPLLFTRGLTSATVWVDAVQLEPTAGASTYQQRRPVEATISTGRTANLFYIGESVDLTLQMRNSGKEPASLPVRLTITDYWDRTVFDKPLDQRVDAGKTAVAKVPTGLSKTGFYHVVLSTGADGAIDTQHLRMGVIFPYAKTYGGQPSFFGINHSYYSDFKMNLVREVGTSYVRDWSLMWDGVQQEEGPFDFTIPDRFIERIRKFKMIPLACLSQVSSRWSTSAPSTSKDTGEGELEYRWFPPKSMDDYSAYVKAVVAHNKGKIKHWEILNEPYWKKLGEKPFTGADYMRFLKIAYATAKETDPGCVVIGGISGPVYHPMYQQVFEANGLKYMDALNIHPYYYEDIGDPYDLSKAYDALNASMDSHGGKKPMWATEYGTWANDYPQSSSAVEMWGVVRGMDSERLAADSIIRQHAIGIGSGVECMMFHPCSSISVLNYEWEPFEMMDYGGTPRKTFAVLNVLAWMLPPGTRYESRWTLNGQNAYYFTRKNKVTAVVWAEEKTQVPQTVTEAVRRSGVQVLDLMGNGMEEGLKVLTPCPLYITGTDNQMDIVKSALNEQKKG